MALILLILLPLVVALFGITIIMAGHLLIGVGVLFLDLMLIFWARMWSKMNEWQKFGWKLGFILIFVGVMVMMFPAQTPAIMVGGGCVILFMAVAGWF